MIGYAMLGANDPERARAFYAPLVALMGGKPLPRPDWDTRVWFQGANGGPPLCLMKPFDGAPATFGNGTMLGLPAQTRAQVRAVHAKAIEQGAIDEGMPGVRGPEAEGWYGAYFRDPDGNKLCIYFSGPE